MLKRYCWRAGALLALALVAGCGGGGQASAVPSATAADQAPTAALDSNVTTTVTASPTIAFAPTPTVNMAASPAVGGAIVQATIQSSQYNPARIEVTIGTTVTWTNEDDIEHSVTSGPPGAHDTLFESGLFLRGQAFSHAFNEPGEFAYFCMRHNSMVGTVVVTP